MTKQELDDIEDRASDWLGPANDEDADYRADEMARFILAVLPVLKRMTWQWTLAHNLSIAGVLCRAFALGEYFERDMMWPPGTWRRDGAWAPGCKRSAP